MSMLTRLIACTAFLASVPVLAVEVNAQEAHANPFAKSKSWAYQLKSLGPEQRKVIELYRIWTGGSARAPVEE